MHTYKDKYVCLNCRICYKDAEARESKTCPQCNELMENVSKDFQAPRKNKNLQWKKIEALLQQGANWKSCGCNGPGYRPKSMAEMKRKQSTGRR